MKFKLFLSLLTAATLLSAEDFNDFLKNDQESFANDKKAFAEDQKKLNAEFDAYKKVVDEEFNAYKKSLGKFWSDPKVSTKKTWVEYSKDMQTRKVVDFENNSITIDVHSKDPATAKIEIAKALANVVSKDTTKAFADDQLSQNIEKRMGNAQKSKIPSKQILAPLIFKKPPTKRELISYVKTETAKNRIKKESSKVPSMNHYSVTIPMPKSSIVQKAQAYLPQARIQAKEFKIPLEVVLAVVQTESSFNPMARSHIPAYGLMQIVPRSAGRDVYKYLYNQQRLLSPSYLYNADNNIKLGTAYLSMLYYKYLKPIDNPQSRLYCAIAAYNTGAGNVAKTFSGTTNPYKAAPKINRMNPQEVYNYLRRNLKYEETRHYITNVSERAAAFKKVL